MHSIADDGCKFCIPMSWMWAASGWDVRWVKSQTTAFGGFSFEILSAMSVYWTDWNWRQKTENGENTTEHVDFRWIIDTARVEWVVVSVVVVENMVENGEIEIILICTLSFLCWFDCLAILTLDSDKLITIERYIWRFFLGILIDLSGITIVMSERERDIERIFTYRRSNESTIVGYGFLVLVDLSLVGWYRQRGERGWVGSILRVKWGKLNEQEIKISVTVYRYLLWDWFP